MCRVEISIYPKQKNKIFEGDQKLTKKKNYNYNNDQAYFQKFKYIVLYLLLIDVYNEF